MSLITKVGSKSLRMRLQMGLIYLILILGSVTMIYPFLLMISGSFKSSVDINDFDIIPRYFFNDEMLYRKFLESKYNESVLQYNIATGRDYYSFEQIQPPVETHPVSVSDWRLFLDETRLPMTYFQLGHTLSSGNKILPEMARKFRDRARRIANDDIEKFNRIFQENIESWFSISQRQEKLMERRYQIFQRPLVKEFYRFKEEQERWHLFPLNLDWYYVKEYLQFLYSKDIKQYNNKHKTKYANYSEILLDRTVPDNPLEREDWIRFVREELNLQFIRISPAAQTEFTKFLIVRYPSGVESLNAIYGIDYKNFAEIDYPDDLIHPSARLADWADFIGVVPAEFISLTGPGYLYQEFLKKKYNGDLFQLNHEHLADYKSFDSIAIPVEQVDWSDFLEHTNHLRWEFAMRNYRMALDFILIHGRGIWNTFIYCMLAIILALIINPLAAYALSRYNLPSTYKILLFFMATMVFPAEVTMIPNFLLLKELHLLNTYWALVLPTMANGFAIFLLKGFFDSLPRELYESATIDGAGEWVLFWNITMTLSKPILAVIALQAFTSAYGTFMFALIVCQDQRMWTLMVWLYQIQQFSHQAVIFAALLMAAIPTFIVFVFCQNVILRGIIVPVDR